MIASAVVLAVWMVQYINLLNTLSVTCFETAVEYEVAVPNCCNVYAVWWLEKWSDLSGRVLWGLMAWCVCVCVLLCDSEPAGMCQGHHCHWADGILQSQLQLFLTSFVLLNYFFFLLFMTLSVAHQEERLVSKNVFIYFNFTSSLYKVGRLDRRH